MASSIGSSIKVDLIINCQCGHTISIPNWQSKEHKSFSCSKCDTNIDMQLSFHTYRHHVCRCDELVNIGVAEAVRPCGGAKCLK
jgi:hypothetical protein